MVDYDEFFHEVGKLKKIKRTGWVREGIPEAESVAEHVFRVALMSFILAKKDIDVSKTIKMALVHELGEAVIGDVVVERDIKIDEKAKEEKEKAERDVVKKLCDSIGRQDVFDLWIEYDEQTSEEAKFVKQMDKLEMAFQAHEYEKEHGKNLEEFFNNTKMHLKDTELIELFEKVVSKRK